MAEKLHEYQGWGGRLHEWKDDVKTKYSDWRESNQQQNVVELLLRKAAPTPADGMDPSAQSGGGGLGQKDYSHIYRSVPVSDPNPIT